MIRLDHVCQRPYLKDCVIAAAAMIANVRYEEAFAEVPRWMARRGVRLLVIPSLLRRLTQVEWRAIDGWFRRFETVIRRGDHRTPKVPVLVVIRRPWSLLERHAVVLYGGWVHDPAMPEAVRWETYCRRNWTVTRIWRPVCPELLDTARLRNWTVRNINLAFLWKDQGQPARTAYPLRPFGHALVVVRRAVALDN